MNNNHPDLTVIKIIEELMIRIIIIQQFPLGFGGCLDRNYEHK